jgi:uncharacterized protein
VSEHSFTLAAITLIAAVVNGALGYGFSSITVPLALLFLTNRILNPALVLIEVVLNAYVLWVSRAAAPAVWRRVLPLVVGLVPGVMLGTTILARVDPDLVKLGTFVVLLPLVLLQAAGYRRPVRAERSAGAIFGSGVGALYAVTTISGPPLALALNNQGLVKHEFRAALALVRLAEAALTALAYAYAGLYTASSFHLVPFIVPSVLIGVPIGAWLIRRVDAESFRRVCMSFDAWVVAFGVATLLHGLGFAARQAAAAVFAGVALLDAWLLYRFFFHTRGSAGLAPGAPPHLPETRLR